MLSLMVTGEQGTSLVCGRYALERKLGKGGVGEVFLALDTQLNRWVAIKRLHTISLKAAERAASAVSEARHLASLQHPNIVTVFDFVEHEGDVMVVMEFLPGQTLEELEAPLPVDLFLDLARQSLEGLSAAHGLGMIHRDIKPGNLMLTGLPSGKYQVKILDFGLAKLIDCPSMQTMDHTGALLGSVYTMTPEQLDQRPIDHRADLYSLGCVFYHALTLHNPFEGDTIVAVIASHLQHSVYPLHKLRPDLPPALCAWVENLFSKEVSERPADASAALASLQSIGRQGSVSPAAAGKLLRSTCSPSVKKRASWPWLVAAVTAVLVALIVGGVMAPKGGFKSVPLAQASPTPSGALANPANASLLPMDPGDRAKCLASLGKAVSVEGTIARVGVNKTGTVRFLNFQGSAKGDLSLVFFEQQNSKEFPKERIEAFVGKTIRVTGTVTAYQGNPQIEIKSWSQITTL